MCTVTVAVQTVISELSVHTVCQVTFQSSGQKLQSNLLTDTEKRSIKTPVFFIKGDGNCLTTEFNLLMYIYDTL